MMVSLVTMAVTHYSKRHHQLPVNLRTSYHTLPNRLKSTPLRIFSSYSTTMNQQDSVLNGKYPAKAHCAKVAAYLKGTVKDDRPARIYLQGQTTRMIEDNDEPQPFRFEYEIATAQVFADLYHSDNVVIFSTSLAVICRTAIFFTTFLPPHLPSSSPRWTRPRSYGLACPFLQIKPYTSTMSTMFALHLNSTITWRRLGNPDHLHR